MSWIVVAPDSLIACQTGHCCGWQPLCCWLYKRADCFEGLLSKVLVVAVLVTLSGSSQCMDVCKSRPLPTDKQQSASTHCNALVCNVCVHVCLTSVQQHAVCHVFGCCTRNVYKSHFATMSTVQLGGCTADQKLSLSPAKMSVPGCLRLVVHVFK